MPFHEVVIEAGEGTPAGFQISPDVPADKVLNVKQGLTIASSKNSAGYAFRAGFGASSIPAHTHTGVGGVVASSLGVSPGLPLLWLEGEGEPGQALFAIFEDPVGGSFSIIYEYELRSAY